MERQMDNIADVQHIERKAPLVSVLGQVLQSEDLDLPRPSCQPHKPSGRDIPTFVKTEKTVEINV